MTELCSRAHELSRVESRDSLHVLTARLSELSSRWQELSDLARDRHILLQTTLQVCHVIKPDELDYLLTKSLIISFPYYLWEQPIQANSLSTDMCRVCAT